MQDTTKKPAGLQSIEPIEHDVQTGYPNDEPLTTEAHHLVPLRTSRPQHNTKASFKFPQRGLSYALIAGVIAGVSSALLVILITLVFSGTFHAASQQIAVDKLTVRTALALAGLELLNAALSLLIGFLVGFIVGRIAIRHRLGFLAGALAGAVFSLMTFLVSLISSYPGNLAVNGTILTLGSLVIPFLLLCLCSIGGGLVSLFGTWVATMRHPHYMRLGK